MPLLGFGVFQTDGPKAAVLEAFKAGYRCVSQSSSALNIFSHSTLHYSHVDSAQYYANEQEVGEAVRESGLKREDLFISAGRSTFLANS